MTSEERYPPIRDYALIGDCHSSALISRDGSVDWCCFHRFDARPVFSRLLDWDKGGHFSIAPVFDYKVTRRYQTDTNILQTRFETSRGVVTLTDLMPVRGPEAMRSEKVHPYHQLIRIVRCEEGEVEMGINFSPRFDYGMTVPRFELRETGLGVVYGGADALVMQCDFDVETTGLGGCRGTLTMKARDETRVLLTYALPHQINPKRLDDGDITDRIHDTQAFWREWSSRCTYTGRYRDQVMRSALVLKALTNAPTGAIVAAPTTSLPEKVGGVRNWDYRYAWLRDSALNLYALFTLGYTEEAHAFMHWLERTTAGRVEDLQILYGVGGERLLPEVELGHLEGYRGSAPVRIGNAAAAQFQLDTYGYLLDTAWLFHRHGGEIEEKFWEFISRTIEVVSERWEEPDEGIWEVRSGKRHHTFSKIMAWVALDRAIKLSGALDLEGDVDEWKKLRRKIRETVESRGVDPDSGALVQAFDSGELDASTLVAPLVGFLPPGDPHVRATYQRIRDELCVDGFVHRYLAEDGLPGHEATFTICTFWMVDNLAMDGKVEEARELFEKVISYSNDVGLLAEEIDPRTGEQLGNFPQAFSHVGLVGAAINLSRASA